eukprot:COSAG06_NODE_3354_length_5468_cov_10.052710_3_plen_205_part_00
MRWRLWSGQPARSLPSAHSLPKYAQQHIHQRADSRQQTAAIRPQPAESREQRAESRQQTADSRQQAADSRQQTATSGVSPSAPAFPFVWICVDSVAFEKSTIDMHLLSPGIGCAGSFGSLVGPPLVHDQPPLCCTLASGPAGNKRHFFLAHFSSGKRRLDRPGTNMRKTAGKDRSSSTPSFRGLLPTLFPFPVSSSSIRRRSGP